MKDYANVTEVLIGLEGHGYICYVNNKKVGTAVDLVECIHEACKIARASKYPCSVRLSQPMIYAQTDDYIVDIIKESKNG